MLEEIVLLQSVFGEAKECFFASNNAVVLIFSALMAFSTSQEVICSGCAAIIAVGFKFTLDKKGPVAVAALELISI